MNCTLSQTLILICLCVNVREIYSWGIRGNEGDSAQAIGDFETKPVAEGAAHKDSAPIKSSRTIPGESVNQQSTGEDDRNRRQYVSGRQYKLPNVSVEYMPGKGNGTWSVEKQEKTIELSKEVLETQHATCQVTTEELVATAQATVTRVLKGLCNASDYLYKHKKIFNKKCLVK